MRSTVVKWHVTYFGNPGLKFDRPFGPRVVVAAGAAIYSQRYGISLPALILILTPVEESWYM